jgi:hypothetical protein
LPSFLLYTRANFSPAQVGRVAPRLLWFEFRCSEREDKIPDPQEGQVDGSAVLDMWTSQTNEDGERLSQFERDALIERHCELFGTWPD